MADWVKKGSSWTEKKWDDDTKKENKWSENWHDKSDKLEKTTEKGEPWPTGSSSSDAIWTPEKKKNNTSWAESSPTGKAEPETDMPSEFKTSKTHYDVKTVCD